MGDFGKVGGVILMLILAVAGVFAVLVVMGASPGIINLTQKLSNSGSMLQGGDGLTVSPTSINWGLAIIPGSNIIRNVTITNKLESPLTLNFTTGNWNPANAQQYFNLTWDYHNQPLQGLSSLTVNFTLAVSANITGITSFSFDITINGNGV